jgi:hypothetical protein
MAISNLWFKLPWIGVALAISLAPGYAFALPQACKSDGGKTWYFSIGKTVFEMSNFDPAIFNPASFRSNAGDVAPDERLIPPNPAVPIGCRDNPQQLRYFEVWGWPRLQPVGYAGDMPIAPGPLWLIRFSPPVDDAPKEDKILFWREESIIDCENKKFLKRFDDGTILCTDQPGDKDSMLLTSPDLFDTQWEFIISAKRYSTPLGDNLVVDNGIQGPSAIYLLNPDILLNYSWNVIGRKAPVDPAFLISVDQSIISAIQSSEVSNYPWPKEKSVKSEK